jgi:hypothetical protein
LLKQAEKGLIRVLVHGESEFAALRHVRDDLDGAAKIKIGVPRRRQAVQAMDGPGEAVASGSGVDLTFLNIVEMNNVGPGMLIPQGNFRQYFARGAGAERPETMLEAGGERYEPYGPLRFTREITAGDADCTRYQSCSVHGRVSCAFVRAPDGPLEAA